MELIKTIADYLILITEISNVKIEKENLVRGQKYAGAAALLEKEKDMQLQLNSLYTSMIDQRKALTETA